MFLAQDVQIPSEATANPAISHAYSGPTSPGAGNKLTHTHTITLPALSIRGKTGSVTIVNGVVTAFTLPT